MKYLNLGCGDAYSTSTEWVNVDFISKNEHVIAHNLLKGIPFKDNTFELVYHSHVLEHLSKEDGEKFIKECYRVLKPKGIIRIAIPNLENIAKEYIKHLEAGINNPEDEMIEANYNWIMIELYDQTVRNERGGNMGNYLTQQNLINEDYIYKRIGYEGKDYRNNHLNNKEMLILPNNTFISNIKRKVKSIIFSILNINEESYNIGTFRKSGEIHQWMYDRYSLGKLLQKTGFQQIVIKTANTSFLSNWSSYNLDTKNDEVRIPQSLFIEAIKA